MRTILTLTVVSVAALAAACGPRPQPLPQPVAHAPYPLQVPPPGTDYRHRSGPQGFGRTGLIAPPAAPPPSHGYPHGAPAHPPHDGRYDHDRYGYGDRAPHGYVWGDRREAVSGGHTYESREWMTEETWVEGGVLLEREAPRAPHRPPSGHYESGRTYPGPYAEAPRQPAPIAPRSYETPPQRSAPPEAIPGYPGPYALAPQQPQPDVEWGPTAPIGPVETAPLPPPGARTETPPRTTPPWPDAGPEPFY